MFVDEYPLTEGGLLLWGGCGVGKTHLAIGILRHIVLDHGIEACFADYHDLLGRIQGTYGRSGTGATEDKLLGPLLSCELLVLDDLGSRRSTPWSEDVIDRLFAVRYNERLPTIVTTNRSCIEDDTEATALAERLGEEQQRRMSRNIKDVLGDRVLSRLYEMCRFVEVEGTDHRPALQPGSGT